MRPQKGQRAFSLHVYVRVRFVHQSVHSTVRDRPPPLQGYLADVMATAVRPRRGVHGLSLDGVNQTVPTELVAQFVLRLQVALVLHSPVPVPVDVVVYTVHPLAAAEGVRVSQKHTSLLGSQR